jgi:hypothetical protein
MRNDTPIDGAVIWQQVIQRDGKLNASAARALLKMQFSELDHDLMNELSAKAAAGLLGLLKSKK